MARPSRHKGVQRSTSDPSVAPCVALLRGINVGRAKRVAMAELRAIVTDLGYGHVRTLLNSGNVLFDAPGIAPPEAAARIEAAIEARLGIASRVTVLDAEALTAVMAENPLVTVATDPSRLFVAVLRDAAVGAVLFSLGTRDWGAERLAIGTRAAYLWCPAGPLESPLTTAIGRALGDAATTRNWATMQKLSTLVSEARARAQG